MVRACFNVCGLTLDLDGMKDHGIDGSIRLERTIGMLSSKHREIWKKAHGVALKPLQPPAMPVAVDFIASDKEAAAGNPAAHITKRAPGNSDTSGEQN